MVAVVDSLSYRVESVDDERHELGDVGIEGVGGARSGGGGRGGGGHGGGGGETVEGWTNNERADEGNNNNTDEGWASGRRGAETIN